MACDDKTPWTPTDYPYTINRIRATAGSDTNQTTGAWTPATESSTAVVGYFGRGTSISSEMTIETLDFISGGMFKTGDAFFRCHGDCDVSTNDVLEIFEDTAGTTKSYWRCVAKIKELTTFKNLRGYSRLHFLIRREQR